MEIEIKLNRRTKLLDWVKILHGHQERKYSGEPYWKHVYSVAVNSDHLHELAFEIGLCHDIIEDTKCDLEHLDFLLRALGYSSKESKFICDHVNDLTDKYEKDDYPDLNRDERKRMESIRLSEITPLSQSIKYVDMIDNARSIHVEDPSFAKTYFKEINKNLEVMNKGNFPLYKEICSIVYQYETNTLKFDL
jgi:guanosine-3',5'-bis(diphosphate) 3'-pyrophosphohydrolase